MIACESGLRSNTSNPCTRREVFARRREIVIDLVGRLTVQCRMRTMVVIPVKKQFQLSDQRVALEGNQNETRALNLHRLDE